MPYSASQPSFTIQGKHTSAGPRSKFRPIGENGDRDLSRPLDTRSIQSQILHSSVSFLSTPPPVSRVLYVAVTTSPYLYLEKPDVTVDITGLDPLFATPHSLQFVRLHTTTTSFAPQICKSKQLTDIPRTTYPSIEFGSNSPYSRWQS